MARRVAPTLEIGAASPPGARAPELDRAGSAAHRRHRRHRPPESLPHERARARLRMHRHGGRCAGSASRHRRHSVHAPRHDAAADELASGTRARFDEVRPPRAQVGLVATPRCRWRGLGRSRPRRRRRTAAVVDCSGNEASAVGAVAADGQRRGRARPRGSREAAAIAIPAENGAASGARCVDRRVCAGRRRALRALGVRARLAAAVLPETVARARI